MITSMSFTAITSTSMSVSWPVPSQQAYAPQSLNYTLIACNTADPSTTCVTGSNGWKVVYPLAGNIATGQLCCSHQLAA